MPTSRTMLEHDYYSAKEAADILGLSKQAIQQRLWRGAVPHAVKLWSHSRLRWQIPVEYLKAELVRQAEPLPQPVLPMHYRDTAEGLSECGHVVRDTTVYRSLVTCKVCLRIISTWTS